MRGHSNGRTAGLTQRRGGRLRSRTRGRQPEQRATGVTLEDVLLSPTDPPPGQSVSVTPVVSKPVDQDAVFAHVSSPQFGEPVLVFCVSDPGTGPHELTPVNCLDFMGMCGSFDMPDGPVELDVRVGPTVEGEHCSNAPSWPHDDSASLTVGAPFSADRVTLLSCASLSNVQAGDTAELDVTARNDNTQGAIVHVRATANGALLEEENFFIPANTETQTTISVDTSTLAAGTYDIAIEPVSVDQP